jgi:Plasmid pRiA4b ORF-3-like protein
VGSFNCTAKVRAVSKRPRPNVWRVTIRLSYVEPPVWRTILVRPETKLAMFHRYVQAAMGWQDYHLFAFTIGGKQYGIPHPDFEPKLYDARRYALARLFPSIPVTFRYIYDFGDHWEHEIIVEGAEETAFRKQYPICVAGEGVCPPEDCGGPPGYEQFLGVLRDPRHPEHDDIVAWAKSQFYHDRFYVDMATWAMRDVQRGFR